MFQLLTSEEYVDGIYIRYREISGGWHKYNMATAGTGGTTSYTVTSLRAYTTYEFFIAPFFKSIEGQPSSSKFVKTLEDSKYNTIFFGLSRTSVSCYLFVCLLNKYTP